MLTARRDGRSGGNSLARTTGGSGERDPENKRERERESARVGGGGDAQGWQLVARVGDTHNEGRRRRRRIRESKSKHESHYFSSFDALSYDFAACREYRALSRRGRIFHSRARARMQRWSQWLVKNCPVERGERVCCMMYGRRIKSTN